MMRKKCFDKLTPLIEKLLNKTYEKKKINMFFKNYNLGCFIYQTVTLECKNVQTFIQGGMCSACE